MMTQQHIEENEFIANKVKSAIFSSQSATSRRVNKLNLIVVCNVFVIAKRKEQPV